jgi:RNA polymerase sigma-70 factor, ECF subfamily
MSDHPGTTITLTLLRRIKTGDRGALDPLFRRYMSRLRGVVRGHLRNDLRWKVESMDIVQDCFTSALDHVEKFEPRPGSLLSWFSVLARNRLHNLRDHFRAKKRDLRLEIPIDRPREPETEDSPQEIPGMDKTPSQILTGREDLSRLKDALDALDPEQRRIVALRKLQRLGFQEIGRRTGKTADAARMVFSRAMIKLSAALRER